MSYTCNGVRSESLAMAVSQARAMVVEGGSPAVVSNGERDCHVWRDDEGWVVGLNDMLPTAKQQEFKNKVLQLLQDHG